MIKNITLTGIALSALLLSGCGGGGGNTNPISDKNYVVILKNVPSGICESQEYRNLLSQDFSGVITEERSNSVNCGDYNKKNDQIECAIDYYTGTTTGNVACVVGIDGARYNKQAKIVEGSTYSNTIDTKFIQVAE